MSEAIHFAQKAGLDARQVVVVISKGAEPAPEIERFTIFGPTCDSVDVLPDDWDLPADVREGDWIEISTLGAYSNAITSNFNGFAPETFVEIAG